MSSQDDLSASARAALPGLIGKWRHHWEISYDGMWRARRRDTGRGGGAAYPAHAEIAASSPDVLDAELEAQARKIRQEP